MFKKKFLLLTIFLFNTINLNCTEAKKFNVALLIVATGKYINFAPQLINSAKQHFMPDQNVKIFLFTDAQYKHENVTVLPHTKVGWPWDSMNRYDLYYKNKDHFKDIDYIFACDADLLFIGDINSSILSERVALKHPHFDNKRGVYEMRNNLSKAYISPNEGEHYFYGAFLGGSKDEFLKMCQILNTNINSDKQMDYVAEIIDESHVNRYFIDNKPTTILNSKFGSPQEWGFNNETKILYLMKDHDNIRK